MILHEVGEPITEERDDLVAADELQAEANQGHRRHHHGDELLDLSGRCLARTPAHELIDEPGTSAVELARGVVAIEGRLNLGLHLAEHVVGLGLVR